MMKAFSLSPVATFFDPHYLELHQVFDSWIARLVILFFIYTKTLNDANCRRWLQFLTFHLLLERKKHLDVAGIEPGPPDQAATLLSVSLKR